jgi:hypothetical protein
MAKKGLIFLMNEIPEGDDKFVIRKIFRFIPPFSIPVKTIIELELHKNNICVLSFYEHDKGTEKTKYRIRSNFGGGHTLAIFKACLEAYYTLDQDYALVFAAANDVDKMVEDNSRYSAYKLFLTAYFRNYEDYIQQGSIALNTMMLYHQSYQYKDEADEFYIDFEKKVEEDMLSEDESDK